jgi:hypothetical protein
MYGEADVGAIEAAWTARDRMALAELGARLGIALAPEAHAALVRRAESRRRVGRALAIVPSLAATERAPHVTEERVAALCW